MSNKIKHKNSKEKDIKLKSELNIKNYPFLYKINKYLENHKNSSSREISFINEIISILLIDAAILFLSINYNNLGYIILIPGMIFCIINIMFSIYKIYKNNNKEFRIIILISQSIFLITFIIMTLIMYFKK